MRHTRMNDRSAGGSRTRRDGICRASLVVLVALSLAAGPAGADRAEVRIAINLGADVWVEPTTAQAAAKPMFDAVARTARVRYSLSTATNAAELHRLLESGEANLAGASALTYAALAGKLKLKPLIKPVVAGSSVFRLLLLVRRGSGIERFQQLRGKTVSIPEGPLEHQVYWDVLVAREGVKNPAAFFGAINVKKKQQSAVLDVFLGEADACLIADMIFRTMNELNPQLAKALVPIHQSVEYSTFPLFVTPAMRQDVAERGTQALATLHTTQRGRQLLLMFKIDRLVVTKTADYQATVDLWNEYKRLKPKATL